MTTCFNPRPREAGDPSTKPPRTSNGSFNPRPREAGDGGAETTGNIAYEFQSTPA